MTTHADTLAPTPSADRFDVAVHLDPRGAVTLASRNTTLRFVAQGDEGTVLAASGARTKATREHTERMRLFGARVWDAFFGRPFVTPCEVLALASVDPAMDEFVLRVMAQRPTDDGPSECFLAGRDDNQPDTGSDAEDIALRMHASLLRA